MVWEIISATGVGPFVRFQGNINASVYENFFANMLLLIYAKGQLKL